ncbi:Mu-like prophage I protein [Roseivivax halotolerans]|uniref:Mu-like prophage I protein n=1 Tax=Roseivivax halotolerans TaxID=93684 RepID=A0A1I5W3I6_9RHOB|nr:phage protease [Roseivivax halotolerans]SFQ14295.1 Mu-like prophage I protein [Roseivivax halotolerans]
MNEVVPSHLIALNFAEGEVPDWINVIPAETGLTGIDGRQWTMTDANAVIETFRRRGNRLPVDIEHATQIKGARGEAAPAVGFITDMEGRDTGLWARVEWNQAGEDILKARSYAHCSPVFVYDQARNISRLVSVGLTNNPNLDLVALNQALTPTQETRAMDKAVLEALGLNTDASAADAVVAINKLKEREQTALNRAETPDPEKFVPKADHEIALNKVREFETAEEERAQSEIETAVDAAIEAGKVAPASRDFHIAACQANGLEKFTAMVGEMPEIVGAAKPRKKDPAGGTALNADETAIAAAFGWDDETARSAFSDAKDKKD